MSLKRGDTIIEVMFAITIFAAVAVISIAMMNSGIATSERSLELVTARNELNAQAEALRFIHSSYVSERNLPVCTTSIIENGEKCQQFKALWETIIAGAMNPHNDLDASNSDNYNIPSPLEACSSVYKDNNKMLVDNHAFVINTREISIINDAPLNRVYVSATDPETRDLFQLAPLGARIVYIRGIDGESYSEDSLQSSVAGSLSTDPLLYRQIGQVEGIWVVAVRDYENRFYDFYISTCWYGSGANAPTSLDAVIRLYNPEGI